MTHTAYRQKEKAPVIGKRINMYYGEITSGKRVREAEGGLRLRGKLFRKLEDLLYWDFALMLEDELDDRLNPPHWKRK